MDTPRKKPHIWIKNGQYHCYHPKGTKRLGPELVEGIYFTRPLQYAWPTNQWDWKDSGDT